MLKMHRVCKVSSIMNMFKVSLDRLQSIFHPLVLAIIISRLCVCVCVSVYITYLTVQFANCACSSPLTIYTNNISLSIRHIYYVYLTLESLLYRLLIAICTFVLLLLLLFYCCCAFCFLGQLAWPGYKLFFWYISSFEPPFMIVSPIVQRK